MPDPEYYIKNKEKLKEQMRQYYIKNREKILNNAKNYNKQNKEIKSKYRKTYYLKNKDHEKELNKIYKLTHLQKIRINNYKYKQKHIYNPNYYKKKIIEDINYKLSRRLRNRIYKVLNGIAKAEASLNLLGCTQEQFKTYLESQFKPGMSWNNYGLYGWHIDHIIPCAAYDLTKEEEQRKCFHYTNLQPLWAEENLQKSSKILIYPGGE